MLKLAIICGGPSRERGISLNSARSLLDHTYPLGMELTVLYVDPLLRFYQLSSQDLYSNTPSDFDFKLHEISIYLERSRLVTLLSLMDLVFPLIHGPYGEDGTLQAFLEEHGIPFVGSNSHICSEIFNKYRAKRLLNSLHFHTLPGLLLKFPNFSEIDSFWDQHTLSSGILKPTMSGSSLGVEYVDSIAEAKKAAQGLYQKGFQELLLEPYTHDKEFTICVLESHDGEPVSLLPLEIDIGNEAILDYRKKYLPSVDTRYYCPPRFSVEVILEIRAQAASLFKMVGLKDFARIDGWVSSEGKVLFSDLNPISGMEQNSFIFQQAAAVGISHTELIQYILQNALKRYGKNSSIPHKIIKEKRRLVYVLMGGENSERHVSLMSGVNVWLKLLYSEVYEARPFLLENEQTVWHLPYAYTLHHTVDETVEHCKSEEIFSSELVPLILEIRKNLGLSPLTKVDSASKQSLDEFIQMAKKEGAFVFIALHGGIGEDGTLQKRLEDAKVLFNGSRREASSLCMDKHKTSLHIHSLKDPNILPMPQISFDVAHLFKKDEVEIIEFWQSASAKFGTQDLIIKPQCDGCSTGVVRLNSSQELKKYINCLEEGALTVKPNTFRNHNSYLSMPTIKDKFLLEPFIETDKVHAQGLELHFEKLSGWFEVTVAVLEKMGDYFALKPSMTVAESNILSLEEKFQGGTGINITPPPEHLFSNQVLKEMQGNVCRAAKSLGIKNYARLDLFVERASGKIRLIEVNTLPALTPSTVFFHQGLHENPPLSPKSLLTKIIESAEMG